MTVIGDTKKLEQLRRRIARVGTPQFKQRISNVVGQEALARVLEGFNAGRDPYGVSWPKLKGRPGRPLLDTGRLRNSINIRPLNGGFKLATDVKYAPLHQNGGTITAKNARALAFMMNGKKVFVKSVKVPARPFFPDGRGTPPKWQAAFHRIASDFIRAEVGHNARSTALGGV